MILVRGFALRGAIELQDRVDTDFPDSLPHAFGKPLKHAVILIGGRGDAIRLRG
jgi:hypothetical protein